MKRKSEVEAESRAAIGFALGDGPDGVAYVTLRGDLIAGDQTLRVPFYCNARPALEGRDIAYAAMLAVLEELRRRNIVRVCLHVDAHSLVADLMEHRSVPPALSVPYVMLGCAINRFRDVRWNVSRGAACRDLTARARAEVSLHVAA